MHYDDHKLAELFPLMTDDELQELADDIRENGLRESLYLFEGKILDGRNRYRACKLAEYAPRLQEYKGHDPLGFVLSKNLHRRHLTESQRAMVAARISSAKQGERRDLASIDARSVTDAEAAEKLNVSEPSVERAKKVIRDGVPELSAAVDAGDVPVSTAAKVARLPKAQQRAAVKGGPAKVKAAAAKATAERNGKHTEPKPDKNRPPQFFLDGRPAHPVTGDTWPTAAALTKGTKFFPRVILLPSGSEGIYDAYGQLVPAGTGDYFNDPTIRDLRDEWCGIKGMIDEFREKLARVKSGRKSYPWTEESKIIAAVEKMDAASDTILILLGDSHPYLVCPDCNGIPNDGKKGCASCRITGYWPLSKCEANPHRMPKVQRVGVKP